LSADNGFTINIHTNPLQAKLFDKMESVSCRLGEVTESSQGIILYKTAKDAKRSAHTGFVRKAGWKRLLRGKNIARYQTKWGGEYVHYGPWLWCHRDERFFNRPKILLHAMRNKSLFRRLVGTLDEEIYYNAHNLANIIARPDTAYSLKYILGLFNSTLVNFWYKSHFPNVNINPNDFRQIPIRARDFGKSSEKAAHESMVRLVDSMLALHKQLASAKSEAQRGAVQRQIEATDREIDRLVYDLYGLTKDEIAIVEESTGGPKP
jgi:hypothetical protein